MVFYNNTGSYYFKTLQLPLAASQLVVFWIILRYHPCYYCQIQLLVMLTVPFLQKKTQFLKKRIIAIDCSKIIETICYVTNTHPRYTPFIQWPQHTISYNYHTTRDGHKKFTLQQPNTRHKFALRTYFYIRQVMNKTLNYLCRGK